MEIRWYSSPVTMEVDTKKLLFTRRKIEFFVLRQRLGFVADCTQCGCERRFVSIEEAMAVSGTSMLEIFAAVTSQQLHYIESKKGVLMVCEASIATKD